MSPPGRSTGEDRAASKEGTPASTPHAPLPSSLAATEPSDVDLDTRIQYVEQRLILREENLRRTARQFSDRVHDALRPARLLWPLAGLAAVAAAGFGLHALWRGRREPARIAVGPAGPGMAADGVPAMPWVRLLGLAWPLLPQRWRARVSPATVSAVMSLGLPMLEGLLGRHRAAALQAMAGVDLPRFAGTWHIVASIGSPWSRSTDRDGAEAPRSAPLCHFTLRRDGLIDLACDGQDDALVQPLPGSGGAKLKVSRWPEWLRLLPWTWQDQWLLHTDDDYSEALLGSPQRDSLWLLSREPRLPEPRLAALIQRAHDRGFAVQRMRFHGSD